MLYKLRYIALINLLVCESSFTFFVVVLKTIIFHQYVMHCVLTVDISGMIIAFQNIYVLGSSINVLRSDTLHFKILAPRDKHVHTL